MHLERIFELVRKEDIVLWVGSGFSLYAGFPNGNQLAEKIYRSLSPAEQKEISPNLALADVAEQFVRLKDGNDNALTTLLKKEFHKTPHTPKWHEMLAKIPHIQTIITTNYDRLFEMSYKDEIHILIRPTDLVSRNKRVELFKVHGDLNVPGSVVITKSQYANFFYSNIKDNLIWSAIKDKLASKSVLFLGYDLEDENIKNIIREVSEALGSSQKEMFLLAPKLKEHKIKYLDSLGIKYVDFRGEPFIDKLYQNIKDRITTDFSKGWVNVETLRNFYQKNRLLVELKAFDDRFRMTSVSPIETISNGQLNMNFKNDKDFIESFKSFVQGENFGTFTISSENLTQLKLLLNDVNVVDDNAEYQLQLKSIPFRQGTVNAVFEDGTEFENIRYQSFRSNRLLEVVAEFKDCKYQYQMSGKDFESVKDKVTSTFKFEHPNNFANVNDAVATYQLALNILKGVGCTLYVDGDSNGVFLKPLVSGKSLAAVESNLEFFKGLKEVEKIYHVRFSNIGEYTKQDFENVFNALEISNEKVHEQQWDEELKWDINKGTSLGTLLEIEKGAQFSVLTQMPKFLKIYNQEINIGYQIAEPADLYITNIDEVRQGNSSVVKVRSRSKTIRLRYTMTKPTSPY